MERRKAKSALSGGLGVITEVLNLFTGNFTQDEELAIIIDSIHKQPYTQSCGVLVQRKASPCFSFLAARGLNSRFMESFPRQHDARIWKSISAQKQPLLLKPHNKVCGQRIFWEKKYGSMIIFPLHSEGKAVGILYLESVPGYQYTLQDIEVLKTLSTLVVISLTREGLSKKTHELEIIDDLTALYNLPYFKKRFAIEFARAQKHKEQLALCIINLDNFEEYCLQHGTARGETLLIEAATIIRNHLRTIDIIGRYSVNQIIATLYNCSVQNARKVAARVSAKIQTQVLSRCRPELGLSIGITGYPAAAARQADDLFDGAEEAVYQAYCGRGTNIRIYK